MKIISPYIGVTDFFTREEVKTSLKIFEDWYVTRMPTHYLMVGVMASRESIYGKGKWAGIFPTSEQISTVFTDHPFALNTLHYADYGSSENNHKGETTVSDIDFAISRCGPHIHAIQFDMVWPDEEILNHVRKKYPNLYIIVQVSSIAMKVADKEFGTEDAWIRKFISIAHFIDYVLFDASMGLGKVMNIAKTGELIAHIRRYESFRNIRVAVAGGLSQHTVTKLAEFDDHELLSCDAQGRLKGEGNNPRTSRLDMGETTAYLKSALRVLSRRNLETLL